MGAVLDDFAVIEDQDPVGGLRRGQTMGNRHHCSACGELVQRPAYPHFRCRIDG